MPLSIAQAAKPGRLSPTPEDSKTMALFVVSMRDRLCRREVTERRRANDRRPAPAPQPER